MTGRRPADTDAPARPVPAGERGVTSIAGRAVAGIAEQAAREALRSGPDAASVPRGEGNRPRAEADVRRGSARVRVVLRLGYPSDIGGQCGAVRRHVAERVGELTGMDVTEVAVRVDRLRSAHLDGDASGRTR
ncbi:Asp23/Gls24 family envelope stress response protein [Streptomyces sp. TR06-5]|uniref:Asp23/Gls24 family envelope stress response protein n=1 Tax=unclassified Streptomyces TaxID=2593676 RepID=UPI0039A39741